jgi:hypothetical protein
MGLARQLERAADRTEFRWAESRLDAPKQCPLLMAHVVPKPLAESVQVLNRQARLKVADSAPNVHVRDEHAYDILIVGPGVAREGRQQEFLLKAEVLAALLTPEVECFLLGGLGIDIGRALQPKTQLKCHVVLARQHGQLV